MRIFFSLTFLLISFVCFGQSKGKSSHHKTPVKKAPISHKNSTSPKKTIANPKNTKVVVKDNTFDFGNVKEGEFVTHRVTIQNVGAKALAISDISAPCVVADYLFDPIAPGQVSYIDITFSTLGKVGEQYREVNIKGNIENKESAVIYIKGVVYPK